MVGTVKARALEGLDSIRLAVVRMFLLRFSLLLGQHFAGGMSSFLPDVCCLVARPQTNVGSETATCLGAPTPSPSTDSL